MSFQYVLCQKWFSRNISKVLKTAFSKNKDDVILLILFDYSLKISRKPIIPLTPAGNKRSCIFKSNPLTKTLGFFKYVCSFVTINIKRLNNTTVWVFHWFCFTYISCSVNFGHFPRKTSVTQCIFSIVANLLFSFFQVHLQRIASLLERTPAWKLQIQWS